MRTKKEYSQPFCFRFKPRSRVFFCVKSKLKIEKALIDFDRMERFDQHDNKIDISSKIINSQFSSTGNIP